MKNDHTNKHIEQLYQKNAVEKSPKDSDDLIIFEAQNSCRPKQNLKWIYGFSTAAVLFLSFSLLMNMPYQHSPIDSNTIQSKKSIDAAEESSVTDGIQYRESPGNNLRSLKQKNNNDIPHIEPLAEFESIQNLSEEQDSEIQEFSLPHLPAQSKRSGDIKENKFHQKMNKPQFDNTSINRDDLSTDLMRLKTLIDINQKKQALLLLERLIKKYPDHDFSNYEALMSSK